MRYKRSMLEAILYLIFLIPISLWYETRVIGFLTNDRFLNILTESAITLSGIGIGLLGIILVLRTPAGIKGEFSKEDRKAFLSIIKRSTAYFLLSSLFAFLCYIVPQGVLLVLVLCSAISTLLFLDGLAHLLYICFTIEKVGSS